MRRSAFLLVCLSLITCLSYAQEVCNDGKDNDGDGFIDCFDKKCSSDANCDGSFLGNDALCQAKPSAFPQFSMAADFSSPDETTNHLSRMAIGDLDRDGIPEIVTMNKYTDRVYVLDGRDGSIKSTLNAPFDPQWEIAIANIDDDNCAEIFTFGIESTNTYLYSYNCDLTTQNWKRRIDGDPINFGLADFNGDGTVELYAKDAIFNAHTGMRLIQTQNWNDLNGGPVAVDMLGDGDLELVVGCIIYDVNLGNGTLDNGSLTELKRVPSYHIRYPYNATSVADYNLDGFLDVLASGSKDVKDDNTTIFYWDVQNDVVTTYIDPTSDYAPDGWKFGTGRLNIADLDGDGDMNVSYVSGKYLYALDENLNLFWRKIINEETSGYTGCTLFDFNGDGKAEIVYRDEQFLYIINGTDGSIYNQQACISRTNREYPIVADVDADGSTEMCVPCGFDDAAAQANFNTLSYSRYSHVRVFKSAAEPWVPARRLWNQHGYFNVNVNDDLTIPTVQQKHHLVFSSGSCTTGPNRPLNGFLNQSPYLNSLGCPTYASPDLAYVNNSLTVNPPLCPGQNFTVSFQITNLGDVPLDGSVPITFYNGDPRLAGAIKLNTVNVNLANFSPAAVSTITNLTVTGPGSPFTLYIVLNDNGTTVPTPISLPNTNFIECDYADNIISSPINPLPVNLTAVKVADNLKCVGSSTPDNGAVRAFVLVGAVENTTDYDFYWFNGATVDPTPDFTGSTYAGIANGLYTVYAKHKTVSCNSDTVSVTVGLVTGPLIVNINIVSPVSDCKNPNGSLLAIANPGTGQPSSLFDFVWYEGNDIFTSPQIGLNDLATNLRGLTYTVLVTEKTTGCETIASATVPDNTSTPVVTATKVDITCSSGNSGSASATVNGGTAGFKFEWSDGTVVKTPPDFTGANYINRPAGSYTVIATNNASKCVSVPVTVTITQSAATTATATKTGDMTSCDPTQPNGSASASAVGGPGAFTFQWFIGQNTLPANQIGSASTVTNLDIGTYTVKATNTTTGCFDTDEVIINFSVVTPTLSSVVVPVTSCNPFNGSITVTPSVYPVADYTFSWYNGSGVKATPDYPDTDNVLSNLPAGDYTVRATHNTNFCITPAITVTVLDNTPVISMVLNNSITVFPSDCTSANGEMTVDVSSPGNTTGFKVEWFFGRAPFGGPVLFTHNNVFTSLATGLKTGVYTVIATDPTSGCGLTEEFDLPFANAHGLQFVSKDDVQTCNPGNDGSAVVRLVLPVPPPPFTEDEFDTFVYTGTNDPGPAGTVYELMTGVLGQLDYPTTVPQTPGFYTYVAVSKNPATIGCRSVPLLVEIRITVVDPVITATSTLPNTNCAGAPGTGEITVTADGASPMNYTFEWFNGPNTTFPPLAGTGVNGEQVINLPAGFYTVRTTNTTATSTGCFSVKTIPVNNNPQQVTIGASGLTTVDPSTCDLVTGNLITNGSATVTAITENGAPGILANYTFEWTNSAGTLLQSGASPTLINRAPDTFFVKATNTSSMCLTNLEFEIKDGTVGSTLVSLNSFESPERCVSPQFGRLIVTAGGTSASGYTFEWYAGSSPSGPIINNTNDLQGIDPVGAGQTSLTRTIKVVNNTNNCWAVDSYIVDLVINEVQATVSASPLTSCLADDGEAFGTVTNDNSLDYNYSWYNGTIVKPLPDATGKQISLLPAGSYTMVATDIVDPFCTTVPQTTIVLDQRIIPVLTALQTAPVTNCDPAKANGGTAASVNGNTFSYVFDWFAGATATGTPFFTGPEAGGLAAGVYSVLGTDRISGCAGTAQVTVNLNLPTMPNPDIVVVSNVTSCVSLNGVLRASVNGETADYIFNWYNGGAVKVVVDYTGEIIDDLDIGTYTVTATSRTTGCTTGPDTDQIIKEQVFPEFDFRIVPSSCDEDNGFASLIMRSNVPIDSIIWVVNGAFVGGPNLTDVPSGEYTVTVVSQLGCSTTRNVVIGTEIHPYNGVSRNSDGKNDIFNISCIEQFPGNNVKIFNRAGTMVYEGNGYDNIEIYFDGKTNRGFSPLGDHLPDGTYYYVIDKRNGSKPLAGYLELVK